MKCKETAVKLFAAILFGIAAVNLGAWGMDSAVSHSELQEDSFYCMSQQSIAAPSEMFQLAAENRPPSRIMIRLFQLMFILFFISPPIIALMLFLIWKELKKRNELN